MAQEASIVSQGSHGSGVGDVRRLSHEARALVLGEHCLQRRHNRKQLEGSSYPGRC